MYYKPQIVALAGAIALSAVAPAFADSQLISSAGLTVEQAEGMSLAEIVQYKFNREESASDRWDPSILPGTGSWDRNQLAASAGVTPQTARVMSLNELVVAKFNHGTSSSDQQADRGPMGAIVATRSVVGATNGFAQLIASAGLTSSEAEGMTLTEIAQYKFTRDQSHTNR